MILLIFLNFLFLKSDSLLTKEKSVADFQNAVSVAMDGKENIYVLDAGSNQIIKFSNTLEYKKRNGRQGWAEGQFDSPTFIDGSSGLDIFVTDGKNHRVQRIDLELNPIASLLTDLPDFNKELRFRTPIATLVLNSSELYVIDGDNNRIVVYKDGKNPSYVFGDYKSGKGQLGRPVKILKDGKNFIYVLDKELKAVLRFDNLGNYVNRFEIKGLENFAIRSNTLYLFDGSEITRYDLEKNSIIDKTKLPSKSRNKKYTDIFVLPNEKYLLLRKNELSLWVKK
ncbi:MAG: NHL repeat-containing protein [Ignavibacteria bacterium]|nr:NHL repeat-containing protein [Ignavibacteria bacterium]